MSVAFDLESRLRTLEPGLSEALSPHRFNSYTGREFFRENCGLAAEVASRELKRLGFQPQQLIGGIRHPEYLGERTPSGQHVICLVDIADGSLLVDASYSQFFMPFGLDRFLLSQGSNDPFPPERSLVFSPEDTELAAEWCATAVEQFWARELYSPQFQRRHGYTTDENDEYAESILLYNRERPPIRQLPHDMLKSYFCNIWDLEYYQTYEPSDTVVKFVDDHYPALVDNRGVYL